MEKIKQTLFVVLLLVLSVQIVSAANIGVSPASISFKNVLRGGYAERPITLTIDTTKSTTATITTWGDISDWITVSESKVSVSKTIPQRVTVSVSPPSDVPNGNYTGFVRINITKLGGSIDSGAASSIIPTLDLAVNVEITDNEIIECRANDFNIFSAEKGEDVIFTSKISNEGNIRFYPKLNIKIWNQDSTSLVKEITYSNTQIIPTQEKELNIKIPSNDLEIGQYWAQVLAVDCFYEKTLTFDILEKGALRAEGSLDGILVKPIAKVDEIIPINASFKNTGQKPLDAKFSGKITLNGKIVQLLESDQDLFVPLNSQESFQFYFTPRQEGRYIISGRVLYDNKRTYESSVVVNVISSSQWFTGFLKFALYLVLLIIIAILIYKIRRERESYSSKWRLLKK